MLRFRRVLSLLFSRRRMIRTDMSFVSSFQILALIKENPSLTAVSEKIGVSLQSVRKTLEALDKEYACQLFRSITAETAELSDAGLVYASAAVKICNILSDADRKAEKIIRERQDAVIAGSVSKGLDKRLRRLDSFRFKNIFLDTSERNCEGVLRNLGKDADIVIGFYDDALLKRFRIEAVEFSSEMAVAVPSSSLLAKKKCLDIEDLYEHRLYVPRKGFSRRIDNFVHDMHDFHPRIEIVNADSYSPELFKTVSDNDDFILSSSVMDLSGYSLKSICVDWIYKMNYGLLYSSKSEKAAEVVKALSAECPK